jgi:Nif-specific ferredoxin III
MTLSALTRDGRNWEPNYLLEIDRATCIGCGRCYKVCGRSVMTLMGVNDDDELVSLEEDDDIERKVMAMADAGACVGCGACARVCPTNCQTHGQGA